MSKEKGLKVLVVGAGMYVSGKGTAGLGNILPALYQAKKIGLVGEVCVAATSPASVKELMKKIEKLNHIFGFKFEIKCLPQGKSKDRKSYLQALRAGWRPDCAIISVPDQLHFEITSDLINQGMHCLVVKPLAPSLDEVRKLIKLQQRKSVYGAVEFHKRFDRSNLKLRDTIKQGIIGDLLYFLVEYSQRKNIPLRQFEKWVRHTNVLQYLGIHYIDIIYFATRAVPLRVMAIGQKKFLAAHGIEAFDSIQCQIEWQTAAGHKFGSVILTNWIDPECTSAMSDQKIKVIGTLGRYEADQKNRGISIITDSRGIEVPNPDFSTLFGIPGKEEFTLQGYGVDTIVQFLKDVGEILVGETTIDELAHIRPTFEESFVPTAIIESANKSLANNGVWVKIGPINWGGW